MKKMLFAVAMSLLMVAPTAAAKTVQIPATFTLNGATHKVTHVTFVNFEAKKVTQFIKTSGGGVAVPSGSYNVVCLHRMVSAKKALTYCAPLGRYVK